MIGVATSPRALATGAQAAPLARRIRWPLSIDPTVDVALIGLVLCLAFARLLGADWYATYKPIGMRLLNGWPVSWETVFFLAHLPTFLGDAPPSLGIAPVDYRTYVNLFLYTQLYGWTGSAFWSLAAVDLLFWSLATVCTYHLGLRLGLGRVGAGAGALLVASSPLLTGLMWHEDMHLANIASLPIGLWAALTLIQEHRSRVRLAGALGCLLVYLSVTYQFQWIVAPAALILASFRKDLGMRAGVLVVGGAVVLFAVATAAIQRLLVFSGLGPTPERMGAVQQPTALLAGRTDELRSLSGVLDALPGPGHILATATAYHPAVFVIGFTGLLCLMGWQGRALAALAFVLPLLFMRLYPPPWVAMSGYPLVYLGAGQCCAVAARALARLFVRPGTRIGARPWTAIALALLAVLALAALTNRDLAGDPTFLLRWWDMNASHPLY